MSRDRSLLRIEFSQRALRSFGETIVLWADDNDAAGWIELRHLGSAALHDAAVEYGRATILLGDGFDRVQVLDRPSEAALRLLIREMAAAHQLFGRELTGLATRALVSLR